MPGRGFQFPHLPVLVSTDRVAPLLRGAEKLAFGDAHPTELRFLRVVESVVHHSDAGFHAY